MTLNEELKQENFSSEQQRLIINVMFTGNFLNAESNRMFKNYDISNQQFNVLRILRGQKGKAITVKDIESRMLDKSSNVSRLIDKLLKKSYVKRMACCGDRRRVDVYISEKGLDFLASLDDQVTQIEQKYVELIDENQAKLMNELLDKLRTV
jgi:DNA-binding MarR family transcriptional regulator